MSQRLQNEGEDDKDIRLLLIGKTGSGKSATGNIFFNDRLFESEMRSSSVTRFCQKHTGSVSNRRVTVIDTPDFIFSTHTDFDSDSELKKALELCSPGAHVILLILPLSTFSEHEKDFINWFEQKFGAEALRFTLVLFTHAFKTHQRPLREIIRRNIELSGFINRCSGGFCGINITDPANRRQVTELMEKIDGMVSVITNSCYTLEMMLETERRREEDEKRAEKERRGEEERRREEEMRERRREDVRREKVHQMELDRVRIETEIRMKKEFEQKLEEERAKILRNKEKAEKRVKHSLLTQKNLKYAGVIMVCALVTGGVSVWNEDSSHGWMFTKGFFTGGSASTAGVLAGIFWRLKLKSQFIRSSSHERPSAVRQLLLKTAGVVCDAVFAGAVILFFFLGENLLHFSVSAGATGALTAIHWSP